MLPMLALKEEPASLCSPDLLSDGCLFPVEQSSILPAQELWPSAMGSNAGMGVVKLLCINDELYSFETNPL